MNEHHVAAPFETVVFRHLGREFQACLDDAGSLRVTVTGRRNGKMFILPEGNNAATIRTEQAGMLPSQPDNQEDR